MRKNKSQKGIRPSQWGQVSLKWTDRQAFATRHSHQRVLHRWQRSLSSQGSLMAFKSPGSLGAGSFTPLKVFGALPLREPSPWKTEVCSSLHHHGGTGSHSTETAPHPARLALGALTVFDSVSRQRAACVRTLPWVLPPINAPNPIHRSLSALSGQRSYIKEIVSSPGLPFPFSIFWDAFPHSLNYEGSNYWVLLHTLVQGGLSLRYWSFSLPSRLKFLKRKNFYLMFYS